MKQDGLFLHEEILLLALRDREGTVPSGAMYQYAVGGALVAELLLAGRIVIDESQKKKLVNLVDPRPVGEPVIDDCLERIATAKKRASLQTWVSRFASTKNLKHRLAHQLCSRGILRADEETVLLLFTRRVYPEVNPVPEKQLLDRMRKVIFTDVPVVDPRTVVLISLAHYTGLLRVVFDKKRLKEQKRRIEGIINGEVLGQATKEAIEAVQAAVMVACIMPAVTS